MLKALKKYRIKPDRRLGQNFLCDGEVLRREVAYAEIGPGDAVLEIGPGVGTLTERLLQSGARVVAIERDRQFGRCLEDLQRQYGNLEIVWGDALEAEWPHFEKVVANLPYKVALPIVFRLLETRFERGVLIFQRRLAERICAGVGEKGYCRLGVSIGRRVEAELLEVVGRRAFWPEPEVESAIVKFRRVKPRFAIPSEEFFRQVLEGLFAFREESVERAASRAGWARGLEKLPQKLRRKRVAMVTPQEFGQVARVLWEGRE